jgi:16S rRNA (adenine1518-N6/adenine1519-N6)-dimethyltransferase
MGQNFLIDANIIDKIVRAADLSKEDLVVEIGPGLGALTVPLALGAGKVLAVEIDRGLATVLEEVVDGAGDVEIICEDALKVDFDALVAEKTEGRYGVLGKPYKLVANLPYYITSPLLMHLLTAKSNISQLVVMVQHEVGARLAATPGTKDYGVLSVATQYYTKASMLFRLPGSVFYPAPAVDSAVIRLTVQPPAHPAVDEGDFFKVVRAAFAKRRKTLLNALVGSSFGLDKGEWQNILEKASLDPKRRGETLSLEEFARLSGFLPSRSG